MINLFRKCLLIVLTFAPYIFCQIKDSTFLNLKSFLDGQQVYYFSPLDLKIVCKNSDPLIIFNKKSHYPFVYYSFHSASHHLNFIYPKTLELRIVDQSEIFNSQISCDSLIELGIVDTSSGYDYFINIVTVFVTTNNFDEIAQNLSYAKRRYQDSSGSIYCWTLDWGGMSGSPGDADSIVCPTWRGLRGNCRVRTSVEINGTTTSVDGEMHRTFLIKSLDNKKSIVAVYSYSATDKEYIKGQYPPIEEEDFFKIVSSLQCNQ